MSAHGDLRHGSGEVRAAPENRPQSGLAVVLARYGSKTVRACLACIQDRTRQAGSEAVAITFKEFKADGARLGSIPAAIDFLVAAGLVARAGFVKRPRGHPAMTYRLLAEPGHREQGT